MALTVITCSAPLSSFFAVNKAHRLRPQVLLRSLSDGDSVIVSPDSLRINGSSSVRKNINELSNYDDGGKNSRQNVPEKLEPLWDDGYGTRSLKDYYAIAKDLIKCDRGPPRWFCPVSCGVPLKDSPVLLYLPGMDGTGLGLVLHEKALGKVFHVQCLHIPVWDRTPFEGLIEIVEETVMIEHASSPNKPVYLLGDSFGGCLALAVAARNPTMDLIVILANPATSFERSPLQPLLPLFRALPEEFYGMLPFLTFPLLGDQMKIAAVEIDSTNHLPSLWQLFGSLVGNLSLLSGLTRLLPKDTLSWKLKLIESAAAYANSRLHNVTAEVLVLASGKDNLLPSKDEARRLSRVLKHCNIRVFEDNGHTILLESGVNLLSAIKVTYRYRRSSKHDLIEDFVPPSISEFESLILENWWCRLSMGAAMFSTMEDGTIVRGLAGIPDEGPVLVVGNHMLWGFDVAPLVAEFLREKKIMLHGLAHPELFGVELDDEFFLIPCVDIMKLFGAVPVSGRNLFRLLARKSYTLLYPGGAREALHRKGEAYKLFWPEKHEFVRMAVKFGATIIPFGVVGEDDISELVIDYHDMKRIPFIDWVVNESNKGRTKLREGMDGEIANQQLHLPIFLPKLPGRLYYVFGKPIRTKGKEKMLDDKDYVQNLYMQIKSEVEKSVAYLMKKREEDPYRSSVGRFMFQTVFGPSDQVPSFEP